MSFGTMAFLLACHELSWADGDILWHLKGGEWIWQHARVPDLDPFTFGSEHEHWVDIHWLGQIVFYLFFRFAGIAGIIILSASVTCLAVLLAYSVRPRTAALDAVVVVWVPALLLASTRFIVRPETFTLLLFAAFLAVLIRFDERPRLAWLLPPLQVIWVNVQGLFVFGPVLVGLRLAERAGQVAWRRLVYRVAWTAEERSKLRHLGGSFVLVCAACFVTPYGLRGTFFPLILLPKATEASNLYKTTVMDLISVRNYISSMSVEQAGNLASICSLHFCLLLLPVSFLLPALIEASKPVPPKHSQKTSEFTRSSAPWTWLMLTAAAVLLLACSSLTLSPKSRPALLVGVGHAVPLLFGLAGIIGGVYLLRRSRSAALLASVGGVAMAVWGGWLHDYFVPASTTHAALADRSAPLPLAALGLFALIMGMTARWGANIFLMLLTATFGYLALSSRLNLGRFGIIVGLVLSYNLAPFIGSLAALLPARPWLPPLRWCIRLSLIGILLVWIVAALTDHVPENFVTAGRVGLRERPLSFAHDAVRFAGQSGMPARALVYDLNQASVYTFQNSPARKAYIDGRLEMPAPQTFQTYLSILNAMSRDDGAVAWNGAVRELGDPSILFSNRTDHSAAQASVLMHPNWRLVYFDALAAVFLPRTDSALEARYRTLDIAARHFHQPRGPSQPNVSLAAGLEAFALNNLAGALERYPSSTWSKRIPVLLAALDRAERALDEQSGRADEWTLLARCYYNLATAVHGETAGSIETWDPSTQLGLAQSTYCLRRAVECAPGDLNALEILYRSFAARQMLDAQVEVGEQLLARGDLSPEDAAEFERLSRLRTVSPLASGTEPADASRTIAELLAAHHPEEAAQVADRFATQGRLASDWPLIDRVAGACMHLGRPALARRLWESASAPPSAALRLCRVADTYWVERDVNTAVRFYDQARQTDPRLPEPRVALAWLHCEEGQADAALGACSEALSLSHSDAVRSKLESLQKLLLPYASSPVK
jgi:tetratricopeptide (TPR) repeat protein